MVDWSPFHWSYNNAFENFKASIGAEIFSQLLSVPDTIAFIEFIYEEAAQTALFAIYQAHKNGQDDLARGTLEYLKTELFPDAVGMIGSWGVLNPATQNCFQRFFDAVEQAIINWETILANKPPGYGTIAVYADQDNVSIYVGDEYKGEAGVTTPLKIKLQAGTYDIVAKKEGFETEVKHIHVKEGELRITKFDMKKIKT